MIPNWLSRCPGGHAAEPRQGDDDRHQWSRGVWQAKIKTRDPAVPECPTGAALRTQSAQRRGRRTWTDMLRPTVTLSHIMKATFMKLNVQCFLRLSQMGLSVRNVMVPSS